MFEMTTERKKRKECCELVWVEIRTGVIRRVVGGEDENLNLNERILPKNVEQNECKITQACVHASTFVTSYLLLSGLWQLYCSGLQDPHPHPPAPTLAHTHTHTYTHTHIRYTCTAHKVLYWPTFSARPN